MNALEPKVVICGDGAIGKTCLLKRLMLPGDDFDENYQPTASNNHRLEHEAETGEHGAININFELWDTAGQEALKTLRQLTYPSTNILMIGFDMNKKDSLENVREMWIPEFEAANDTTGDEPPFAIVLVGCKYDMHSKYPHAEEEKAPDADETTEAEIEEVRKEIGAVCTVMTSAKSGYGIANFADINCKHKSNYEDYVENTLLNVLVSLTLQNHLDPDSLSVESKPEPKAPVQPPAATPPAATPKPEPKPGPKKGSEDSGCCVIV